MEGSSKAADVGGRIKQARLEQDGMKQRELADLLGVSERSVIAYEQGEVIPYRFMRELEKALGKPAAWFLHGDAAPASNDALILEIQALRKEIAALTRKLGK